MNFIARNISTRRRLFLLLVTLTVVVGCNRSPARSPQLRSLREARAGFVTTIVESGERPGAPELPPSHILSPAYYLSPVGNLPAYVSPNPNDGKRHPAIVWLVGGDTNSIGDVWSNQPRDNDQSARAFRNSGIVMLYPSLRGGNTNPGQREGFYGEVDDVLAATDFLATLPYVDPTQIYLGGHSTGGTLAMLVGEYSDLYRAIFALGPVDDVGGYGGRYVYCDINNDREMALRSPLYWLDDVKRPMYVFEGGDKGNWSSVQAMSDQNDNSNIQFFKIPGHDHFSTIAPLTELLAAQILAGEIKVTEQTLQGLR